jgi:hypothetical protein
MTTLYGSLRLRPTRIGFLVSPTNMAEIRRIMQACSCLWGGLYNPIIPVCDEIPEQWRKPPFDKTTAVELTKGYLDFFEPDVFVESESGLAARAQIENMDLDLGHSRIVSLDAFFDAVQDRRSEVPLGLNIFALYQDLYDREFKFVRRHDQGVALLGRSATTAAFVEAAFGGFPERGFLSGNAKAYVDAFNPLQLAPTAENWIRVIKEGCATPLTFTTYSIKQRPHGYSEPTLFVVDPNDSLDLIDLWNLRQFNPNVLPVNLEWADQAKDFLRELIVTNYRLLPGNPHGFMICTTVQVGRSISEDRAKAIVFPIFSDAPSGSCVFKLWYERIWNVDRVEDHLPQPRRARVAAASKDLELPVSTERSELSARFPSLSPEFAPLYGDGAARWTNVLKLHTYGNQESIALVLPSDFTKEGLPRLRLGGHTFVSREGLVLPQKYKDHGEHLSLLTGTKTIIEWLRQRGIEARPSDAGRIADQVLNAIGGVWGAYLFADAETLRLLDDMAKSVRRYNDGTMEEFEDRAAPVEVWEKLISRRKSQQRLPRLSLDEFVKANILKLGFSVECPNCMKKNWCSLRNLDEQIICERCLKEFSFPQGSLNFRNTPWQYRVVGPFSVPNFAAGAYATVLALRLFFQNLGSHAQLTYSTNLDITIRQDKLKQEIDFTFWYLRDHLIDQDEEPVLVFGEAKSFATQSFKPEDVNRMETLATKFPGAFFVFATLKDTLSDDERSMIGKLALWGREPLANGLQRAPVIVLTGTELFSDWHVTQAWKDCGDKRGQFAAASYLQLDNLWTLADLTQQIYLGLPDKYAELRQRLTNRTENR